MRRKYIENTGELNEHKNSVIIHTLKKSFFGYLITSDPKCSKMFDIGPVLICSLQKHIQRPFVWGHGCFTNTYRGQVWTSAHAPH